MQLLQFAGLLVIANALAFAAWMFGQGKGSAGLVTFLSVALIVGLTLVLSDRISELTLNNVGTIKTSVVQAQADAEEVAKIRVRVEHQAATLDLVAKESADAKKLLADLQNANKTAEEKVKQLEQKTAEATKLAEPVVLRYARTVIHPEANEGLFATIVYEASKPDPIGAIEFQVAIIGESSASLIRIYPSLEEGGNYLMNAFSLNNYPSEKRMTLNYQAMEGGKAAINLFLSGPARVRITGNRLKEPQELEIKRVATP